MPSAARERMHPFGPVQPSNWVWALRKAAGPADLAGSMGRKITVFRPLRHIDERHRPLPSAPGRRAERRLQASANSGDTGLEIVVEFHGATVSGADPIDVQKGLTTLLTSYVEGGVGARRSPCAAHRAPRRAAGASPSAAAVRGARVGAGTPARSPTRRRSGRLHGVRQGAQAAPGRWGATSATSKDVRHPSNAAETRHSPQRRSTRPRSEAGSNRALIFGRH